MEEVISNPETGEHETLGTVPSVFRAVQLVGRILRETRDEVTSGLHADEGIAFGATMLLGGRVGGEALRLYMIYDAGNAIECQPDTPYLQIGEFKYGKPILDRRSAEHTSELQSLMRISYAVFCLKKKQLTIKDHHIKLTYKHI